MIEVKRNEKVSKLFHKIKNEYERLQKEMSQDIYQKSEKIMFDNKNTKRCMKQTKTTQRTI